VIDDLFLRKLPPNAGDELADVLMSRHEKSSTVITSNRILEDWAKLLGDVVVVAPLLDRLMHHGHLLKFDGKSWRLKEAAARCGSLHFPRRSVVWLISQHQLKIPRHICGVWPKWRPRGRDCWKNSIRRKPA
jgi:hypothetical protein